MRDGAADVLELVHIILAHGVEVFELTHVFVSVLGKARVTLPALSWIPSAVPGCLSGFLWHGISSLTADIHAGQTHLQRYQGPRLRIDPPGDPQQIAQ